MEQYTAGKYHRMPNFDYIKKIRYDIARKRNLSLGHRFPYMKNITPKKPKKTFVRVSRHLLN